MDHQITSILRRVGHTDALMQGHALSAQLVSIALISILPGFGSQGVVISYFLMTLICGILEVPTGYFADRFGWRKSLILGSILTIISTCCMLAAVTIAVVSSNWIIWVLIAAEAAIDALALAFISGAYQAAYQALYVKRLHEQGLEESEALPLFLASYKYGVLIRFGLPLFALLVGFYIYSIYPPYVNDYWLRFLPIAPMLFVLLLTFVLLWRISSDLREIRGETKTLKINWREIFHLGASTHVPLFLHAFFRFAYLVVVICVVGGIYHLLKDMGIGNAYIWLSGMSFALMMRLMVIFFGRAAYHRIANLTTFNAVTVGSLLMTSAGGAFAVVALNSTLSSLSKVVILFLFGVVVLVLSDLMTRLIESKVQRFIPEIYRATWFSGCSVLSQLAFALVAGLSLLINIPFFSLGVFLGTISVGGFCLLFWVRGRISIDGLVPISLRGFLVGSGILVLSIHSLFSYFLQIAEYTQTLDPKHYYMLFSDSSVSKIAQMKLFSVMGTHILLFCVFLFLLICISRLINMELNAVIVPTREEAFDKPKYPIGIKEFSFLRKQLSEHQQKLMELEHARGMRDSAVKAAHDIRSPLSSLKAAVQLLKEHVGSNYNASEGMNLLQLSSQRLENIANDLLSGHHGKASSGPVLFSIHEVLDELLGELRATPVGDGIEIVKKYSEGALYVHGDKNGISRAIGNIIKNAFEAMQGNSEDKPRQLMVTTSCEESDSSSLPQNDIVCIRIADTGSGIPADIIPLILQGGHTEGKSDGHGIGTKVVRDVLAAHEGALSIDSEMGRGTVFTVAFPKPHSVTESATQTTVTIPYAGAGTIRVIDDEPSLREQWRITLKGLGAAVETFPSWEEFDSSVALLPQNDSTFIVDYHFDNSEIDGLEIMRHLKALGFTNLVLATAEYWKPAIRETTKQLGVVLCPKPLPKVVLSVCHPESEAKDLDSAATPQNDIVGHSVLLIDDDLGIHITWQAMCKTLGIGKLSVYSTLEEMIAAAANPAEYDLCVIDKNIEQSDYNGASMLAYLKQNGARRVFVATGESRHEIEADPAFAAMDGVLAEKIPMSLEKLIN